MQKKSEGVYIMVGGISKEIPRHWQAKICICSYHYFPLGRLLSLDELSSALLMYIVKYPWLIACMCSSLNQKKSPLLFFSAYRKKISIDFICLLIQPSLEESYSAFRVFDRLLVPSSGKMTCCDCFFFRSVCIRIADSSVFIFSP